MTLRRVEIVLWAFGLALLTMAAAASVDRWNYQAQQERALFERGPAVSPIAQVPTVATTETHGPMPAPPVAQAEPRRKRAADPAAFAKLVIPRLGVSAIVKEGNDERTLARAVGLVPGSPRPGEEGNVVLAAHRDTFFWPLQDIETNDRIRLVMPSKTFEYRVRSVRVVPPEETGVLASRGEEELTLVTCYPFRYIGPAPERFIVTAARVR